MRAVSPMPSLSATEDRAFHDGAVFVGVWLLVVFVGVKVAAEMRIVLVPLLWAFFLMMGLLPVKEVVERCLSRCVGLAKKQASENADGYRAADLESDQTSISTDDEAEPRMSPRMKRKQSQVVGDCCCAKETSFLRGTVNATALVVTLLLSASAITLFVLMIYNSFYQVKANWGKYVKGSQRLSQDLQRVFDRENSTLPVHVIDQMTQKSIEAAELFATDILSGLLDSASHIVFTMFMTFLYMMFWLSHPIFVGQTVLLVFKNYILLKSLVSMLYGLSVWVLLQVLQVDLAVVFGLITFVFNFVPEFGPLAAAALPLPVILLDGSKDQPYWTFVMALCGQFALKCFYGNIVEVMLIESRQEMKMHPVIILFFVAFFGWLWGATGMLLSVPLVAAAKALIMVMPDKYANPLFILLEGDISAPQRFKRWTEINVEGRSFSPAPTSWSRQAD